MSTESLNFEGYYNCSRDDAKELFRPYILLDGMYLVRPSESKGASYTISVTKDRTVQNFRIQQDPTTKLYFIATEKFCSVSDLIKYYKLNPITQQSCAKLVTPVMQKNQLQRQNYDGFVSNYTERQERYRDLPGLHCFLPRTEVKRVMEPYLHKNGAFLLRPSSTEKGLTLSIVHKGTILKFKINQEKVTRNVYILALHKFESPAKLIGHYKAHPLKPHSHPNDNVLLIHPILVEKEREEKYKLAQDELYAILAGKPLPPSSSKPDPPPSSAKPSFKRSLDLSSVTATETPPTLKDVPTVPTASASHSKATVDVASLPSIVAPSTQPSDNSKSSTLTKDTAAITSVISAASPLDLASVPTPVPPPLVLEPAPPPPTTTTSSSNSRPFTADDLVAGRTKLTTAVSVEKPASDQKGTGLEGTMEDAFDQFKDRIGVIRSFVEDSDDDYEDADDWD